MLRSIILMFFGVLIIGASIVGAFIVTRESPLAAQTYESGWQIDSFAADYNIQPDGSIRVRETLAVDFGSLSKHGIFRVLVTDQKCAPADEVGAAICPDGRRRLYTTSNFEVTDGNGRAVPVKKEGIAHGVRYRIGDPDRFAPSDIEYRISYTLEGALNPLDGADELYWNVTGEWPVPIVATTTTVRLPGEGTFEDQTCYFGGRGSTTQCDAEASANAATFRTARLSANQQATISAIFPKGIVSEPIVRTEDIRTFRDFFTFSVLEYVLTALVAAATIAGVVFAWWRKGRDRRYTTIHYLTQKTDEETLPLFAERNIVVEFLPPEGMRPAEMGTLIKEGSSARDVSATVVDLAVRGYLVIEEVEKKRGKDWTFKKVREADDTLLPYERKLFNAIFKGRESVKVSSLKDTFATDFQAVKKGMMDSAMAKHWFPHRPENARIMWAVIGFLITAAGSAAAFGLGYIAHQYFIAIPIAVAGVLMLGFSAHMSRRTAAGHEALRRTLGFELYVSTAETRMQEFNEQQNIFARYLPYAIAFDCVDKWAKAFQGLENNPQAAGVSSWYYGGAAGFSASQFSSSMNSFSNSVSASFASTPSSSGSGGGGGGFSGGGGGGGGGGSW